MKIIETMNIPIFDLIEHFLSGKLGLNSPEPKQKLEKHKSKIML
jgi:hypothetical protein